MPALEVNVTLPPEQNVAAPPAVIVGVAGSALTVKFETLAAVPAAVVTLIFPVVAVEGKTAVMVVEFTTVNDEAPVPLNWTAVAPVKFVPVRVTVGVAPAHADVAVNELIVGKEL